MADNGVIHFYPSKFVLITDILDNFGKGKGEELFGGREGVGGKEEQLRIFVLFFLKVHWFMTEYVRSRHILHLDHQNLLNYLVSVLIFPSDHGL